MLGASLAFAGMAACIKLAAEHGASIWHISLLRGLVSIVLLVPYLRLQGCSFLTQHWKAHALRGIWGFLGMYCYIGAIALMPLATAITLNYLSPIFLALMLALVHDERPSPYMLVSIAGSILGVILLLKPTFDPSQEAAALMALGSAVLAAVSALNIRHLGALHEPTARTVFYFSLCIALGSLPGALLTARSAWTGPGVAYAIAAGLLATGGQVLLTLAYQRGVTLLVSLLGYSQVVFSSLLGIVLWNARPTTESWVGVGLVIVSGAAAALYASRPRQI